MYYHNVILKKTASVKILFVIAEVYLYKEIIHEHFGFVRAKKKKKYLYIKKFILYSLMFK